MLTQGLEGTDVQVKDYLFLRNLETKIFISTVSFVMVHTEGEYFLYPRFVFIIPRAHLTLY